MSTGNFLCAPLRGDAMTNVAFGSSEAAAILIADQKEAYERRRKPVGQARCACNKPVTLWAETEEWYQLPNGKRWYHAAYGTGSGECSSCGRIVVETMEGRLLVLGKQDESSNREQTAVQ